MKQKTLTTKGRAITITIADVLYVPSLKDRSKLTSCRLLSLSRLQQNSKASVQFSNAQACIHLPSGNNIPIYRPEDTFLYYVDTVIKSSQPPEHTSMSFTAQSTADNPRLTHQRFDNQGKKCIINSQKETGQTPIHRDSIPFCNTCSQHKATTSHINKQLHPKPTTPFYLVGVDIWTPSIRFLHNYKYAVGFIDYYSNYVFTSLLLTKGDAEKGLQAFINYCKKHGFNVKTLRLDNDKAFKADKLMQHCFDNGITCEFSAPYSPHQNGLIDRTWRTLSDMCFTMLQTSGLKDIFWEYSFNTAV